MTATYAFQKESTKRTARARLTGINASFKDLGEVCRAVRYNETDYAIQFLERAAEGEQAILMSRHGKGRGHVRQLGGKQGGWPVKSARIVLGVVKSAFANANKLGLGTTKVAHIIANKEHTFPRMSPKGRRIVHNFETAFVEVVLEEFQKKAKEEKKAKKVAKQVDAKAATPVLKEAAKPAETKAIASAPAEAAKPAISAPKETAKSVTASSSSDSTSDLCRGTSGPLAGAPASRSRSTSGEKLSAPSQ